MENKRNIIRKSIIFYIVLSVLIAPVTYHYAGYESPIQTVSGADPPDGWGAWTGDIGSLSNNNDTLISNNADNEIITESGTSYTSDKISIIFKISSFSGSQHDFSEIFIRSSGTYFLRTTLRQNGQLDTIDGGNGLVDTGVRIRPNIKYAIEFRNIDYGSNSYDLYINNESIGTYNFANSVSSFNQIKIRHKTNTGGVNNSVNFYDIRLDGNFYNFNRFSGGVWKNFSDLNNSVTANGFVGWYEGLTKTSNSVSITEIGDTTKNQITEFGEIESSNEHITIESWSDSGSYSPSNISFKFHINKFSGETGDYSNFGIDRNGLELINVYLRQDGSITTNGQDTGYRIRPNLTYAFEIKNIDYNSNTYELWVNGDNLGSYNFLNGGSGFNVIRIEHRTVTSGDTNSLYFNNIRINGNEYNILKFEPGVLKGFGDDSTNITATGWGGFYNGLIESNEINLSIVENTKVGNLTVDNGDTRIETWSGSGLYKYENVSIKYNINEFSGGNNDYSVFTIQEQNTVLLSVFLWQNGKLGVTDGNADIDTGIDIRPNITYAIEIRNINYSNNTFVLHINGDRLGVYNFRNGGNGFNAIEIGHRTVSTGSKNTLYFNDLRIGGPLIEKPNYIVEKTGFGFKGWYETGSPFSDIDKDLVSGSFSVNGSRENAEIYSSGGEVSVSPISTDITVTERTHHPDDTIEFIIRNYADRHMAVRLHMSTANDQYDPNSDIDGNAITVRDGGAWREINIQWNNNTENSVEFTNINYTNQSYSVRINGELATNPVTGNELFTMDGNIQNGMANAEIELDSVVSNSFGETDNISINYNDLSLGQCLNNCGSLEFFNVTTGQQVMFTDPSGLTPTPTPGQIEDLILRINKYMDYGTKQIYEIIYIDENGNRKDVSSLATVTSSNSSVVTVLSSTNQLEATNNTLINKRITINATYQGLNDSVKVTVANATLENIEILPNTKWISTIIGVDDPDTNYGLGSDFQWIFFIILMMVTFSLLLNEMAGIAVSQALLILFFITNYIPLAIMLGGLIFGLFAGIIRFNKRNQTTLNVERNNNI